MLKQKLNYGHAFCIVAEEGKRHMLNQAIFVPRFFPVAGKTIILHEHISYNDHFKQWKIFGQ